MKKLHNLIHNLSQGEKRFVKIRLNGNKSSSLLNTYFHLLSKQKKYSFEEVQKVGKQSTKLTQSNLSILFDVILTHLQSHYSSKNIEHELRGDLIAVKILMDKGFFQEAKLYCKKLIKKAELNEEFQVLKSAYEEYWNIHLLNEELNDESNLEIQKLLNTTCDKENNIVFLERKYRQVTTLYYNYFFKKRDPINQVLIKNITNNLVEIKLLSDKSKHIYYEIKSIEYAVQGNIEKQHEIRKKQFKQLLDSPVFEVDHLQKLMVLSNVFTKLKSEGLINELNAYVDFMEKYFCPILEKNSVSVLIEKYYDIYFINKSFLQAWSNDEQKLNDLLHLFKSVINKGYLSNSLLLGRIYLSLIELQIIIENYEKNYNSTTPLLIEFFNVSKKNKYSKLYIEGDLLFLVENLLQKKTDTFNNAIDALNRKLRNNDIELDKDQKTLLELLNDIFKEKQKEPQTYIEKITNKQNYKLLIYKLLSKDSISEIRAKNFQINDPNYSVLKDKFLQSLNNRN